MNKGEFSKALGRIVNKYPSNTTIIGRDRDFVVEACRKSDQYRTLASEEGVALRVTYRSIANGRKVKMLSLCRKGGVFCIPISRGNLVKALYPTKSKLTPEQIHRGKVIEAMRNMVSYQLTQYRQSLTLPVVCWRTGKTLYRGDIDHIGEPFIKIAEDWLRSIDKQFSDLVLKGKANDKRFKGDSLTEYWKSFHEERATLALVCSKENRSAGSGNYTPDPSLLGSFKWEDSLSMDF